MHQFIQNKSQPITKLSMSLSCNFFYSMTEIKLLELTAEIKLKKLKEKKIKEKKKKSW